MTIFFQHLINIFVESAPWLLLGYFMAGLIKVVIPTDFLQRHLGESNQKSVFKAALLGAPLPLCSCGVIPAALGLRRAGASKSSTTAFLIATPETGVDSVSVTYALLGPFMAIVRPIAAIVTAIAAGLAVLKWGNASKANQSEENQLLQPLSSCSSGKTIEKEVTTSCCSEKKTEQPKEAEKAETKKTTCCSSESQSQPQSQSKYPPQNQNLWLAQLIAGLRFTFIDLVKDTSKWLLLGFVMAALVMTFIAPSFLQHWGATPYAYILMAIIGVPMYICATASTPIAASLLFTGVSPGAVLIFMLVGPATNVATLAMVKNELGPRVLAIYLGCVVLISFLFGLLTDLVAADFYVGNRSMGHTHGVSNVAMLSAIILAILIVNGLYLNYRKRS